MSEIFEPRLVMLSGVCAGIGKSTLAQSLVSALQSSGTTAEWFPEEDLFRRTQFGEVARGFRTKEFPTPPLFEHAYAAYFVQLRKAQTWGVCDWSCAGMAADLPWALEDEATLVRHLRTVRLLATGLAPIVLDLVGDIRTATLRAMNERGSAWVARYLCLAAEAGYGSGPDLDRIVAWTEAQQVVRRTELAALAAAGWTIAPLDAMASRVEVLSQAWDVLTAESQAGSFSNC